MRPSASKIIGLESGEVPAMTTEEPKPTKEAGDDRDRELNPDRVIYDDDGSLGIMPFLPPNHCRTCED